ncbi:PAS domain S-box protein [Leptospira langatensis]|uniref:histidine kinase n=1 Tax=Leptospira langatensis TaxID=2484983 RepID=A0A5F1ZUJ9_9LEPT|nr:ATP-binding protein [Leptospira langatensis]TGK01417.1 PAS domain S-box protein [Leptospira langatensis]TGL42133.1 PAS domain S-box protein [Leptospira langatensis]
MLFSYLKKILAPPVHTDAEKAVSIRLLYGLMYVTLIVAVLFRIIHPLVSQPKDVYYSFYLIPAAVIVCHILAKKGRIKLGAHLFILLEWLALLLVMRKEGGVHATAFSLFMVIILLASMLLGNFVALMYALASFFAGAFSIFLMEKGKIPAPTLPEHWAALVGNSIGFFVTFVLMRFGLGGLNRVRQELSQAHLTAKLGGWILNVDTLVLTLSKEYRILLGEKDAKESITLSFETFLQKYVEAEEDRKRISLVLQEALNYRKDPNYSADFIFQAKGDDGKQRYILVHGKYKDHSLAYGTGQDITEKYLAEEEIKASQELFSKVFKLSPYASSISNFEDGRYIDINDGFTRLMGYTREEAIGKTSIELGIWADPKDRDHFKEQIAKEGFLYNEETLFRAKDGRIFTVEFSTRFAMIDGEARMINMVKDISERKEAEQLRILNNEISAQNELIAKNKRELEEALEYQKKTQNQLVLSEKMAALGQLVAGIAHEINNPIGVIRAANESVKSHFMSPIEKMKAAAFVLGNLNVETAKDFEDLLTQGRRYQEILPPKEVRAKTKILEAKLKELGIEESRNLAEGLVEAGLENALEDYPKLFQGEKTREILQYALDEIIANRSSKLIEMSVDRTSKIVYALKNFSHFRTGGPKSEVNLKESIDTVLTIYQNQLKSGIEIVKEYEHTPAIQAYSDDLLHVWTNLIYNAAQAMNFKGILKIKICKPKMESIQIRISDTGPGIPESIQERIFEPFFTTKAPGEGSGLGLDIVKRIVENHDGSIHFETSPDGTTFFVNLPN